MTKSFKEIAIEKLDKKLSEIDIEYPSILELEKHYETISTLRKLKEELMGIDEGHKISWQTIARSLGMSEERIKEDCIRVHQDYLPPSP